MIQFGINREYIVLQLSRSDILQLQGLNRISKETTSRLKYSIRITHQINKFCIGEHFHQFLHASRVRGILAKKLSTLRIPQRDLNQFGKSLLKNLQFRFTDSIEKQVFICIFLLISWQEPEIIVGIRHHVGKGKLFLLRQIDSQLHIIRWPLIRHQPTHVLFKEWLSPHH